jgi:hypothetical protein
MATQWGLNTLGPGKSASWFFARGETAPFSLLVITVLPLSDFSPAPNGAGTPHFIEELDRMSFPTWNALGVSTLWSASRQAGVSRVFTYYLTVFNFSPNTVAYAFIEAEL